MVVHDEVGVEYSFVPSPSQAGQAPNGLLNENSRGSISGIVNPDTGQANLAEKIVSSPPDHRRRFR